MIRFLFYFKQFIIKIYIILYLTINSYINMLTNYFTNPQLHRWIWKFIVTPLMVGIFFGIGHFGAFWLSKTKYVKKF